MTVQLDAEIETAQERLIELLEGIRKARRLIQNKDLAKEMNFCYTTLFLIATKKTKSLSSKSKTKLASFLKIPTSDLEGYLKGLLSIEIVLRNLEKQPELSTKEQRSSQILEKFYATVMPYLTPTDLFKIFLSISQELIRISEKSKISFLPLTTKNNK